MTTHRQSGHLARAMGENWENALEEYHGYLANQGRAKVHKTGPQVTMRNDRRMQQLVATITGPGPADYVGCLADGRFVGFEAKTTGEAQGFTLPEKSLHQREWLRSLSDMSNRRALAFYLVLWRAHGDVRLHWIETIADRRIRYEDGQPVDGFDWCGLVEGVR
jgi:penicillin-binding protein-related factor A (putative recombinase)